MPESHAPISDAADQGTGTPSDPALSVSMEQGVILVATEEAAPLKRHGVSSEDYKCKY